MRAHLSQPDVGGIVKGPNGWVVTSVANLQKYKEWSSLAKRFIDEDDATKLQERVRDQDKQIQALRARVGAVEREHKIFLALVKKATGVDLTDEVSVQEALSRSSRTTTA